MIIAAFDFDGTITRHDTLLPFQLERKGYAKAMYDLLNTAPVLLAFVLNIRSRRQVKEALLTQFFGGIPLHELQKDGKSFANSALDNLVKPAAIEKLRWHQNQGHRCILLSASVDCYLEPWARRYGFDDLLCSKLEIDSHGLVTGKLQGENCWGPEKVRRLIERVGPRDTFTLYAYGDSRGDKELLETSDYPNYRKF